MLFFFSAWFIGDVIESDGRVHLATPVDPLLLVIPYLRSAKRPGKLGRTAFQLKANDRFEICFEDCTMWVYEIRVSIVIGKILNLLYHAFSLSCIYPFMQ